MIKIAFLGDIAFIGKYNLENNKNAKLRLGQLAKKLQEYDLVIANLESPLTEVNRSFICKSMHLKSPTINIELLKYLNIGVVSLANNHAYDYGKKGLNETIEILEANNIEYFGVDDKYIAKVIEGERINISGFCCYSTNACGYMKNGKGINTLIPQSVYNQLEKDLKDDALSILSFHWGDEHTNFPRREHIEFSHELAQKYKAIIYGHHPHVMQGIEKVKDSLIAYSLGNFCFDDCTSINGKLTVKLNDDNKQGYLLEVNINEGKIIRYNTVEIEDKHDEIVIVDNKNVVNQISNCLEEYKDKEGYDLRRKKQYMKTHNEKFGNKDLNWLINRLNYYSIGAVLKSKLTTKVYNGTWSEYIKR